MISKFIEIDNISKIKENVLNYNIFNDKVYIDTGNKKYVIDYSLENEENLVDNMESYFNILKSEIIDKRKERKLFKNGLVFIIVYTILITLLSFVLPFFIPILLNIPSLIFGAKIISILKDLNVELKQLNDEKIKLSVVLDDKKMDLQLNHNIGIINQQEKEKIEDIINKLNDLKDRLQKNYDDEKEISKIKKIGQIKK